MSSLLFEFEFDKSRSFSVIYNFFEISQPRTYQLLPRIWIQQQINSWRLKSQQKYYVQLLDALQKELFKKGLRVMLRQAFERCRKHQHPVERLHLSLRRIVELPKNSNKKKFKIPQYKEYFPQKKRDERKKMKLKEKRIRMLKIGYKNARGTLVCLFNWKKSATLIGRSVPLMQNSRIGRNQHKTATIILMNSSSLMQ